jgi:hypothetical protein
MILRTLLIATCCLTLSLPAQADRATNKRSVNARKKDEREHSALAKSAETYWRNLRWNDVEGAALFVEHANDRLLYQTLLDTEITTKKIIEARVLRVDVSPEKRRDEITDGKMREALVTVSVEGYTLPGQVLEKKLVEQRWYRSNAGWWIVWTAPKTSQP